MKKGKNKSKDNEFFIGWQSKDQLNMSGLIKSLVILFMVGLLLTSFAISHAEKGFADSQFEFGNTKTFEGIYFNDPYPVLLFHENKKLVSALLVGFGKMGATDVITAYERKHNVSLEGLLVTVSGTKIFRGARVAIELTDGEESLLKHNTSQKPQLPNKSDFQRDTYSGEIVDIKCFLGVMKPATDKPHRSCAIRCISGGIPPMLRIIEDDEEEYYLLTSTNDTPITSFILPYVADKVKLCGRLSLHNGWKTLSLDPGDSIERLWPHWANDETVLCSPL